MAGAALEEALVVWLDRWGSDPSMLARVDRVFRGMAKAHASGRPLRPEQLVTLVWNAALTGGPAYDADKWRAIVEALRDPDDHEKAEQYAALVLARLREA